MSDEEALVVLKALGRAIEDEARATRYVIAIGFVAVVIAIVFVGAVL